MKSDKCMICGHPNDEILEQHHIIPRNHNGPDDEWNLVTLCPSCHRAVERIYSKKIWHEVNKIDVRAGHERDRMPEHELDAEAEELF